MVFSRNHAARAPGRRRRARARLVASFLGAAALLAPTGVAHAQPQPTPSDGGHILPAAAGAVPSAGQAAAQTSQTVQAAGAQAAAIQQQPTNVAIQIIVNSPGATAVINQANSAAATAMAGNASSTVQAADQTQEAGDPPSDGGTGAAVGQTAATVQDAGAQSATNQGGATNVAITAVVGAPSAGTAVTQVNAALSGAVAANTSSTTQLASQTQSAPAGDSAPAQPAPDGGSTPAQSQPAEPSTVQLLADLLAGTTGGGSIWVWIWNWEGLWTAAPLPPGTVGDLPLPTLSSLPDFDITLPGWTGWSGGTESGSSGPRGDETPAAPRGLDRRSAGLPAWTDASPFLAHSSDFGSPILSSNFVQDRSRTGKTARTELRAVDPPVRSPDTFVGGGPASGALTAGGIALGALILVALQLLSAASALSRRFDLASAAWRRQAYLSPLERPG